MAISKVWRKARGAARTHKARRKDAVPGMVDLGLSAPARRVNRLVAVVALVGAFGTVALAVALTPGAQTSASNAGALQAGAVQAPVSISRIEVPPAPVETVRAETTVVAVRPEPAPKGDRLMTTDRAPQSVEVSRSEGPQPLRGMQSLRRMGGEGPPKYRVAMIPQEPVARRAAVDSAERKLDDEGEDDDGNRDLGFGLSDPPAPGERVDDARDDTGDDVEEASAEAAEEVSEEDIDEAAEGAVEQAVPEAAPEPKPEPATRTAAVRTDVNMRARPDNSGAVIQVVPGGKDVDVIGCDYWCEVIYDGRRGFIYKDFVTGS
ncbi:MAG: SH3 domain-containing protein [Hyphomicrobiales bacterium]